MKKKIFLSLLLVLVSSLSVFSMGQAPGQHKERSHRGGGGVPEPAMALLILGGAGAAYAAKKFISKK